MFKISCTSWRQGFRKIAPILEIVIRSPMFLSRVGSFVMRPYSLIFFYYCLLTLIFFTPILYCHRMHWHKYWFPYFSIACDVFTAELSTALARFLHSASWNSFVLFEIRTLSVCVATLHVSSLLGSWLSDMRSICCWRTRTSLSRSSSWPCNNMTQ